MSWWGKLPLGAGAAESSRDRSASLLSPPVWRGLTRIFGPTSQRRGGVPRHRSRRPRRASPGGLVARRLGPPLCSRRRRRLAAPSRRPSRRRQGLGGGGGMLATSSPRGRLLGTITRVGRVMISDPEGKCGSRRELRAGKQVLSAKLPRGSLRRRHACGHFSARSGCLPPEPLAPGSSVCVPRASYARLTEGHMGLRRASGLGRLLQRRPPPRRSRHRRLSALAPRRPCQRSFSAVSTRYPYHNPTLL
jgi:hypothetical protein